MKNLKKILLLLMSSLLLLSIVACSKKTKTDKEVATASDASQIKGPKTYGKVKLGKFKGIDLPVDKSEVDEAEIQAQIDRMLSSNPKMLEVKDRKVANGDIANIDYEGKKDGVAFDGGSAKAYDLEIGSGSFIPGFEEAIIDMEIGQTKDIPLTFPKEYHSEELAGKEVIFTVKLNAIKEKISATLDDAWVKEFTNGKQNTVDEFKEDIKKQMQEAKNRQIQYQEQNDAMKIVMDASTFEPSDEAIQYEKDLQYEQINKSIKESNMTMENLLAMYNMTSEQLDAQIDTYAKEAVNRKLLVDAIAKKAKIKVKDEHRQFLADQEGISIEDLNQRYGKDLVEEAAKRYAVVKYIVDNANKKERDFNKLDVGNTNQSEATKEE